jgi:MFS family permease
MRGFLQVYGYPDKSAPTGYNIPTVTQQLITSFLNVGTIVGVLVAAVWANYLGRRPAIWLGSLISCVAAGIQVGTTNLVGIYFGRILIGISNGIYITFANVYTAEASPAHLRAGIVAFFGVWVSAGSILGSVANNFSNPLGNKLSYQIPLASLFAIPVFLSIIVAFIPESPRWLLVHGQTEKARAALKRLRGDSFKNDAELLEEEFQEMVRGIGHEKELATGSSVLDMFRGSDLRRTLLCYAVIASHASSGLWMIIGYGVRILAYCSKPSRRGTEMTHRLSSSKWPVSAFSSLF